MKKFWRNLLSLGLSLVLVTGAVLPAAASGADLAGATLGVGGKAIFGSVDDAGPGWAYHVSGGKNGGPWLELDETYGGAPVWSAFGSMELHTSGRVSVSGANGSGKGGHALQTDGDLHLYVESGSLTLTGGGATGDGQPGDGISCGGDLEVTAKDGDLVFNGGNGSRKGGRAVHTAGDAQIRLEGTAQAEIQGGRAYDGQAGTAVNCGGNLMLLEENRFYDYSHGGFRSRLVPAVKEVQGIRGFDFQINGGNGKSGGLAVDCGGAADLLANCRLVGGDYNDARGGTPASALKAKTCGIAAVTDPQNQSLDLGRDSETISAEISLYSSASGTPAMVLPEKPESLKLGEQSTGTAEGHAVKFHPKSYTLTLEGNGGLLWGGETEQSVPGVYFGRGLALSKIRSDNKEERELAGFTDAQGRFYGLDELYIPWQDTTLTAQWKESPYKTINFDTTGEGFAAFYEQGRLLEIFEVTDGRIKVDRALYNQADDVRMFVLDENHRPTGEALKAK